MCIGLKETVGDVTKGMGRRESDTLLLAKNNYSGHNIGSHAQGSSSWDQRVYTKILFLVG